MSEKSDSFARLHRPGDPLFLPNAWDFVSAAVLVQAGYEAIGTTSLGVAAAAGKPDAAGATRQETLALATLLARLPVLLTVDIEAGFSDVPAEVAAFAVELVSVGVVGINLEDGRPDGTLSSKEDHCAKVAAVKSLAPDLYLNARSDAFWLAGTHGQPAMNEALERSAAYVAAGADGIYIPGIAGNEVKELSSAVDAPLNVLYLPGKDTFAELATAGAGRVSTGSLLVRATLQTIVETARRAWRQEVVPDPARPTYHQVESLLADG
jgi:2-methylisocitrate lyase-like PEP mutase family enzyme